MIAYWGITRKKYKNNNLFLILRFREYMINLKGQSIVKKLLWKYKAFSMSAWSPISYLWHGTREKDIQTFYFIKEI